MRGEEDSVLTANNGYRVFDPLRAGVLVAMLAQRCNHFVKTRVQKAAFFATIYVSERQDVLLWA